MRFDNFPVLRCRPAPAHRLPSLNVRESYAYPYLCRRCRPKHVPETETRACNEDLPHTRHDLQAGEHGNTSRGRTLH